MTIVWKTWRKVPQHLGHGVAFHDLRRQNRSTLVAWLEGYEWLDGRPETVVVACASPDAATSADDLEELKAIVGRYIEAKNVPDGPVSDHFLARPNR
jgi:hypothetical protein